MNPRTSRSGRLLVLLAVTLNLAGLAASKRSRVFRLSFETVWAAAVNVANDAFLPDRTSTSAGRLWFRTGPLRAYRFEVIVVDAGAGKTRVEVYMLTNRYRAVKGEKDGWRRGEQYLALLTERLYQGGQK